MTFFNVSKVIKVLKENDVPYTLEFCTKKKGRSNIVSVVEMRRGYLTLKELLFEQFKITVSSENLSNKIIKLISPYGRLINEGSSFISIL